MGGVVLWPKGAALEEEVVIEHGIRAEGARPGVADHREYEVRLPVYCKDVHPSTIHELVFTALTAAELFFDGFEKGCGR